MNIAETTTTTSSFRDYNPAPTRKCLQVLVTSPFLTLPVTVLLTFQNHLSAREIPSPEAAPAQRALLCTATRSQPRLPGGFAASTFSAETQLTFVHSIYARVPCPLRQNSLICFVIPPNKINHSECSIPKFHFNPWSWEQFSGMNQVLTIHPWKNRKQALTESRTR